MDTYYTRRAREDDRDALYRIREAVGSHIRERRGVNQWHDNQKGRGQIDALLSQGDMHVVENTQGTAVGAYALSTRADRDFWTEDEAAETDVLYLYKLMVDSNYVGSGLGHAILRHIYRTHDRYRIRIDCWRGNDRLHRFFQNAGFRYIDDRDADGRDSGTLFEVNLADFDVRDRHIEVRDVQAPHPANDDWTGDRYDTTPSVMLLRSAELIRQERDTTDLSDINAYDALTQAARVLERYAGEERRRNGVANRAYNGDM